MSQRVLQTVAGHKENKHIVPEMPYAEVQKGRREQSPVLMSLREIWRIACA